MKVKTLLIPVFISILSFGIFNTNNASATNFDLKLTAPLQTFAKTNLPESVATKYLENNINMYDPSGGCTPSSTRGRNGSLSGSCGGEITSEGNIARTKEMVEKYGVLAMNLQIAYGISWELLITQMVAESGVGVAGAASQQAQDGLYNWMGLSTCNINGGAHYGTGKTYARPAAEGCYYESYASIDDMMKSYASGDYLRNGLYDAAFAYTDKDNYNLLEYNKHICGVYVGGHDGVCDDSDDYIVTTMEYLKYVREKASELGYPTTEELQKQQNIPIGGNFALGSTNVYDDSISCGSSSSSSSSSNTSSSSSSSSSSSNSSSGSSNSGCDKLAKLRQDLWNAASEEDKEYFMGVAYRENGGIALEGFFNQIVAYKNGSIHDWLNGQCVAFGGGMSCTSTKHSLTEDGADEALKSALSGSNKLNFAIGNATGGSSVSAGKITCVWDGSKCRDDVNYDQPAGTPCSSFTSSSSDECWGLEGAENWPEEYEVSSCSGSGTSTISSSTDNSNICKTNGASCTETVGEDGFPNYYQGDPQWSQVQITEGCTIGACACGATSYAEIVTALSGQAVTPVDVANMTASNPYWKTSGEGMVAIDKSVGERYGLEVQGVDVGNTADILSKIKKYLSEGWLIHLSGNVGDRGGLSSGVGHYVSILSIRNTGGVDEVLVTSFNNLNGESYYGGNHWVPLEDMGHVGIYENTPFSITRRTSSTDIANSVASSLSNSSGKCSSTSVDCNNLNASSIGQNGLSEELTALFLARYAANENGATEQSLGSSWTGTSPGNGNPSKNQCTTVARFFVDNFTKGQSLGQCSGGSCVSALSGNSSTSSVFKLYDSSGHVGVVVGKASDGSDITLNGNGKSSDWEQVGNPNAVTDIMTDKKVDTSKASRYYDWEFGGGWGQNALVVSHGYGGGSAYNFADLDVDTDKLIKYLCTGQL